MYTWLSIDSMMMCCAVSSSLWVLEWLSRPILDARILVQWGHRKSIEEVEEVDVLWHFSLSCSRQLSLPVLRAVLVSAHQPVMSCHVMSCPVVPGWCHSAGCCSCSSLYSVCGGIPALVQDTEAAFGFWIRPCYFLSYPSQQSCALVGQWHGFNAGCLGWISFTTVLMVNPQRYCSLLMVKPQL